MSALNEQLTPLSPTPLSNDELQAFKLFLKGKRILIVDGNASARTGLSRLFNQLGAPISFQFLASSYDEAIRSIRENVPHIVVSDYSLDGKPGMSLIPEHRKALPKQLGCLFVLVTRTSSEAAVAEAAEGDVDAYVLKPFTVESFQRHVVRAALEKAHPGSYRRKLSMGKEKLQANLLNEAVECFEQALTLDSKPSLACFYLGQTREKLGNDADAERDYRKGLEYNSIHFKCGLALFDLLTRLKRFKDAYPVVQKMAKFFPITGARLARAIELAVRTCHYEDIPRYYQIFLGLDERTDEVRKYMSAGLVIDARHVLRQKKIDEALTLVQQAWTSAGAKSKILREIISVLCQYGQSETALSYLKKFPPGEQRSSTYLISEYIISDRIQPAELLVPQGQKLIREKVTDPSVYEILIRRTREVGHLDEAESLEWELNQIRQAQAS